MSSGNGGDSTFEGFAEASTGRMEPRKMTSPTCRAVTPPHTDACGKPATHVVAFGDGDKVHACGPCALYLEQLAESHSTKVRVERIKS